jgi:hypothetical protein
MTADPISADLKTVLRRLKLSRGLDTLPERLALARQQKLPHQDFLLLVLSDEVTRRDGLAATVRAQRAGLDPGAQLEHWDATAKVTFDRALLNELVTLRFLDSHHHVAIVGPVGVGKTFLAHALGHIACRRGHSVLAARADLPLPGEAWTAARPAKSVSSELPRTGQNFRKRRGQSFRNPQRSARRGRESRQARTGPADLPSRRLASHRGPARSREAGQVSQGL